METISYPTDVKAIKEHRCDFCGGRIPKGDTYTKSTHKGDGDIYDWKTHKHCADIATRLKMYDDCDEGLTADGFQESIRNEYYELILSKFSSDDIKKYSIIIQEFRNVVFRDQLGYVIRHYAKIDKENNKL